MLKKKRYVGKKLIRMIFFQDVRQVSFVSSYFLAIIYSIRLHSRIFKSYLRNFLQRQVALSFRKQIMLAVILIYYRKKISNF